MMPPFSHFTSAMVSADVAAFIRLIKSKGGTLGDGVISEREAIYRLTYFVTILYVIVGGRCDFWPLMEAYQVGFGSKCYSFHGLEATLVGGPIWTRDGIQHTAHNQRIVLPGIYDSVVNGECWGAAFYKRATDGWGSMIQLVVESNQETGTYMLIEDHTLSNRRAFGVTFNSTWGGMAFPGPSPLGSWNFYTVGTANSRTSFHCGQNGVIIGEQTGQIINPTGAITTRYMHSQHAEGSAPDAVMGFALIDKRPFPVSRQAEIYQAFKKTLGKEFSLP